MDRRSCAGLLSHVETVMSDVVFDDGGQAYPVPLDDFRDWQRGHPAPGMTLRDYFAGKAMEGLIGPLYVMLNEGHNVDARAESFAMVRSAYDTAAAMIAEKRRREAAV